MPGGLFSIPFIALVILLNSCTPGTRSHLIKKEQAPLSSEQLFTTVADNSLRLKAIDFDAIVYFQKDGRLSAIDRLNNKDTGKWDITNENKLCLKFRIWYYGDTKCYSVFSDQDTDSFIFFTGNGAKYYSAEFITADPHNLAKQIHKKNNKRFLRKDLAQKAQDDGGSNTSVPSSPLPSPAVSSPKHEMSSDIANLARDCPDCNLAGVNLTKAQLIGANLAGADLSGANLSGANLRRANLTGANLTGSKCIATNFAGAILVDSNLSNADLTGSNLIKAKLNGATVDGSIFIGAHLEGIEGYK